MRAGSILRLALVAAVSALSNAPIFGIAVPDADSAVAQKAFHHPVLDLEPLLVAPLALTDGLDRALADLAALGVEADRAFLDARGGTWATLLSAIPLVPGDGVGNVLTWRELGSDAPASDAALGELAWAALRDYLEEHRRELRIDPAELSERVTVHDRGQVIQVHGARQLGGVPVRDSRLTAVINHGNLTLLGVEKWGPTALPTSPRLPSSQAVRILASYLEPLQPSGYFSDAELLALPAAGAAGPDGVAHYDYRLAWRLRPWFESDLGTWEGLVDAHSGELLSFRDTNHYGSARRVLGGVYPISNDQIPPDGVEVAGYPMPFADVNGDFGSFFTDAGGNISGVVGTMTTTLDGQFVRIADLCGAIIESSDGDIDLGTSGGDDCTIPPGHSAGDTHSARSGFYELNRVKEVARGQLPDNTWLDGQLLANMNINQACNAFWDGFSVNFFRSGGGCGNTGELAGVFDHEWGHGMDDNDAVPNISNPGEGIADLYAALRLDTSCVGRGFFIGGLCGGYGDPCTEESGCSGIRDIDWANHESGLPHDVDWAQANCGGAPHCTGHLNSESAWDLKTRDLPTLYGFDSNRAQEVTMRLTFIGAGNVGTWFTTGGNCETTTGCGCGATSGYLQYLAADDDNGNTGDGTPHMNALFDAFERHQIHCTTPTVQDSGCAGRPTVAPVVEASPGVTEATLSWDPIPDATRYKVYRTDGPFQCDMGKILVGEVSAAAQGSLSFVDSGLQDGRDYSYVVAGFPASDSCMGPASTCVTVQPGALFADGFESGDTSAWDDVAPGF